MARKVAIVGCGTIAQTHVNAIRNNHNFELIAACDIESGQMEKLKVRRRYAGIESMFIGEKNLDDKPDLIVIATPSGLHANMAMECIRHGYDCLVEKPVAFNSVEVNYLTALMKTTGKRIYLVLQVRHNESLSKLKDNMDKMGKIVCASLEVFWQRTKEYYNSSPWRGTKQLEGGALLDQGIHYIDALQWLLGPMRRAMGITRNATHENIEIEDTAAGIVIFESGAIATINFTDSAYKMNRQCRLAVVGENGYVELGGKALEKIVEWDVLNVERPIVKETKPNIYHGGEYTGSCPNHPQVYQSIIDNTCPTVYDAIPSISIIEEIYGGEKI